VYLGLADELRQALATYTEAGGTDQTALNQEEAVALMLEKHEVCAAMFHGFDPKPASRSQIACNSKYEQQTPSLFA
jgi:hypothetical protein